MAALSHAGTFPAPQNEAGGGGMERLVDQDKVAAAQALLVRTRAHPDRCGPTPSCHDSQHLFRRSVSWRV